MREIRVGCRGSRLSLIQTDIVLNRLRSTYTDVKFSIITIKTSNELMDRSRVNDTVKDIYTKEIDDALKAGRIDIAVHSLKDVKIDLDNDLSIAAIPDRDDPRDIFISKNSTHFEDIWSGSLIGTSSIRRKVLLAELNPKASFVDIHGNVDTRIDKMRSGEVDGIVLAAAGVKRLQTDIKFDYFDVDKVVPAIGQGALAVIARNGESDIIEMLSTINIESLMSEIEAERSFGRFFGVGCKYPIGANARYNNGRIDIVGFVYDERSGKVYIRKRSGSSSDPESLGIELAEDVSAARG